MEIWNQMSEWMENLKYYNQLLMVFSPRKWLRSPTNRVLRRWDEINRTRKVAGLGSVDAHGFLYRAGPLRLTIFPYKVQFKSLRTHLILDRPLSRDVDEARKQVYGAIRDCRVFVSNYRWGEAGEFRFEVRSGSEPAVCGDEISLSRDTWAHVSTPFSSRIRLIADGHLMTEQKGKSLEIAIDRPGIYRVEAYRGRKGWIFSNHIRINPAKD
jgi:hypothetical protein